MSAKSLMVMGTASDVGKSVVVTALCRSFARAGHAVVPFKAQNMSNNAAVCEGGEIGRAQAVQAEAAGLPPSVLMNPVLLKPSSDLGSQVVICGRARFHTTFRDNYDRYRAEAWPAIRQSYEALAKRFALIVIEGAGGAAEINLRYRDLVNWPVAELADAPVLLVADIDRGGVFASLVGTVELLAPEERRRVKGFIINKFRGHRELLESGLRLLTERTGIPVLGVLPYRENLGIAEEDAVVLYRHRPRRPPTAVTCGVLHLPHIANFTDFDGLDKEPDVSVHYLRDPGSAPALDLVILPGTKATVDDLAWLRAAGWEEWLNRQRAAGAWIVGVCGGYQMLGRRIIDRDHVESAEPETAGLGLLSVETIFDPEKLTRTVRAVHRATNLVVAGYEIHAGRIHGVNERNAVFKIIERDGRVASELEGLASADGRVFGSSIHGLFDAPAFRRHLINAVRASKGLAPLESRPAEDVETERRATYDSLADWWEACIDMRRIAALAGVAWKPRAGAV
ncbi:MAG TPA: cobyric acid synthase [Candidatus Binataceae bacterium]|nr:cobyric acid synthase [Candidatus Binataceae bacterium]